jgi:hypothetical protein
LLFWAVQSCRSRSCRCSWQAVASAGKVTGPSSFRVNFSHTRRIALDNTNTRKHDYNGCRRHQRKEAQGYVAAFSICCQLTLMRIYRRPRRFAESEEGQKVRRCCCCCPEARKGSQSDTCRCRSKACQGQSRAQGSRRLFLRRRSACGRSCKGCSEADQGQEEGQGCR